VILDATFSNRAAREELVGEFKELDIRFLFIETQAPEQVIKTRLKQRNEQDDVVSDARLEDFEILNSRYDPPSEIADEQLITVQTDQQVEQTIRTLYFALADRNISA
jgi:predicted kinase